MATGPSRVVITICAGEKKRSAARRLTTITTNARAIADAAIAVRVASMRTRTRW
jgi:hypothetical protein